MKKTKNNKVQQIIANAIERKARAPWGFWQSKKNRKLAVNFVLKKYNVSPEEIKNSRMLTYLNQDLSSMSYIVGGMENLLKEAYPNAFNKQKKSPTTKRNSQDEVRKLRQSVSVLEERLIRQKEEIEEVKNQYKGTQKSDQRAEKVAELMMKLQEVADDQEWLCSFLIDLSVKTLLEMGVEKKDMIKALHNTVDEKIFELSEVA